MPTKKRGLDLRSMIAWLTGAVVLVSVCVAGALIVITTVLHETTSAAAAATESVRLAEEGEVNLLLHQRAIDAFVRRDIEGALRRGLIEARAQVTTAAEAAALDEAEARVNDFIAASNAASSELEPRRQAAFNALEKLVAANRGQARDAVVRAKSLDDRGDLVGYTAAALLLVGAAGFLLWVWRRAFVPLFEIARQMEQFGRGDGASRVPEQGAAELRTLARGFNEMTSTIELQREHQLTFLAGVAHDLRNPLGALKLSSAAVAPGRPLPPEDRVRQAFARVQRQVDRLERMISDFLDAARIESGNLDLQLEECDLRDVVQATLELFQPTAPGHGFVTDFPEGPVLVTCDATRLEQVLNNLVSNAIKYSPAGGTIRTALARVDGRVQLSVSDEGVGIAPEELGHIFDPFRRSLASKEAIAGVGLGLFVARRIVNAHGGHLSVTSAPGRGSTFTVELPVRQGVEPPIPHSPPRTSRWLRS